MPDLQTSLDLCTYCPRLCSHTCPVSLVEGRETVTPQAKMALLRTLRREQERATRGHAPSSASQLTPVPAEVHEEPGTPGAALYACTGCGACTEACLHGVRPGQALLEGRGLAEAMTLDLPRRQRERAQDASAAVQRAVPPERRAAHAQVAYLPACLSRRPGGEAGEGPAEEARLALQVFDRLAQCRAEAEIAIAAPREACGGYPLYAAGRMEQFRVYAEVFAREVAGHDTLVLGCPACTWLLRTQYPAHGVPLRPKVEHMSEYLARMVQDLPVRRLLPEAIYHDPCYLGRRLGVYEEPRALLTRTVSRPLEFPRSRAEAACTGGGGLLPRTAPETALGMARERLADAPPDVPIVTACPSCALGMNRAGAKKVMGLLELLAEAIA
jgi:Fe-S oxidoreductase